MNAEDPALLFPGDETGPLIETGTVVDLREPFERVGDPEWIQQTVNVPYAEWEQVLEKCPERPLILCCAKGVRSQMCLEMLGRPEGVYAWKGAIQELKSE